MSELHQNPINIEASTFECPHCGRELAAANQLTHEVACARMHREAPVAQPIIRQSSSSAIPDTSNQTQQRAQPMPRREDRRIVENKLVACPNCEKSVREQDINSHMDNECLKNEMIPCEFCDASIPMSNYGQHVESCERRDENHRNVSPDRARPQERPEERQIQREESFESEEPSHQESPERERSPEHGSSQGGIRGFLRNLAGSAATQLRNMNNAYNEHQEQLRQRQQEQHEQRRHEQERQQEMLDHMFGQPQVPRGLIPSNQNALMPFGGPSGGSRVVRTVERGPFGSVIVRQRVIPANNGPFQMGPQPQMRAHPMEVNPLEMLLGMMGGGQFAGLQPMGPSAAPEEAGLDKETIDSLATIKYNKEANKNLSEELKNCPICLDEFEDGQEVKFLWCTHRFHRGCVDTWLDKHTTCPICKKDFKEAEQGFSP